MVFPVYWLIAYKKKTSDASVPVHGFFSEIHIIQIYEFISV